MFQQNNNDAEGFLVILGMMFVWSIIAPFIFNKGLDYEGQEYSSIEEARADEDR